MAEGEERCRPLNLNVASSNLLLLGLWSVRRLLQSSTDAPKPLSTV